LRDRSTYSSVAYHTGGLVRWLRQSHRVSDQALRQHSDVSNRSKIIWLVDCALYSPPQGPHLSFDLHTIAKHHQDAGHSTQGTTCLAWASSSFHVTRQRSCLRWALGGILRSQFDVCLFSQVKAIQARYQSNPEVMQREMSALYSSNNVNPLAGCLPSIVQIPIFIGLYRALLKLSTDNLLNEPFLWLPNLEG